MRMVSGLLMAAALGSMAVASAEPPNAPQRFVPDRKQFKHRWKYGPSPRGNEKRERRAAANLKEALRQRSVADEMATRAGAPPGYFDRYFGCLASKRPKVNPVVIKYAA